MDNPALSQLSGLLHKSDYELDHLRRGRVRKRSSDAGRVAGTAWGEAFKRMSEHLE